MSPAYVKGVEENCRNAEIVFDKFHVIRQACEAVDEVRRAESRLDEEKKQQLKETMWLWRKNPENLSQKEQKRMKRIDHTDLWTSRAYQMRLALQDAGVAPEEGGGAAPEASEDPSFSKHLVAPDER